MLGKTIIATMLDYNAATNARLLACAANLSDDQMDAPSNYSRGSLRQTLGHALTVEWVWRTICRDHAAPAAPPQIVQSPTIPVMQAFAAEEAGQARAFLDGLSEDELATTFSIERRGKQYQVVPWQLLVHMLYHSAQHRAEVAAVLTQYGQSPGDVDFLLFVNPEMRS